LASVLKKDKFTTAPLFSFQNLEEKARTILDDASRRAEEIVARAEQEGRRRAAKIEAAAMPAGREQGRREAFEQAREQAARVAKEETRQNCLSLQQSLSAALAEFDENKRRMLALAEKGLLELALAVARRVCKHHAGASSKTARANSARLVEMVKHETDVELRINPADVETVKKSVPELLSATERLAHVEITPDPAVTRGGCILQARDGTIDATLETQLDRAAAALLDVES